MHTDEPRQDLDNMPRPNTARDLDGETFTRPFVNDSQTLELLTVRAPVVHEVIRPHVIRRRRRRRSGAAAGDPAPGPAPRHLQTGLSPQSIGPVGIVRGNSVECREYTV